MWSYSSNLPAAFAARASSRVGGGGCGATIGAGGGGGGGGSVGGGESFGRKLASITSGNRPPATGHSPCDLPYHAGPLFDEANALEKLARNPCGVSNEPIAFHLCCQRFDFAHH